MNAGWEFRREHLRLQQRSHYVIINGGDQPNVVPSEAAVWYYFRELDYPHIKSLYEIGNTIAEAAAKMSDTTVNHKLVGSAWPTHFNKVIAEAQQKNIEAVGMPKWSEADQTLAFSLHPFDYELCEARPGCPQIAQGCPTSSSPEAAMPPCVTASASWSPGHGGDV